MTAPTEAALAATIEQRIRDVVGIVSPPPSIDAGQWLHAALDGLVARYRCDQPEHCEGRPAWDAARADMMEALYPKVDAILEGALAEMAAVAAVALAAYLAEHPDAPRGSSLPEAVAP